MAQSYVLPTIGNAGMSFTDVTNGNLVKIYSYISQLEDTEPVSYMDFQRLIRKQCGITESNVRMYSPFLFSLGLIIDYNTSFVASHYFSDLGIAYITSLILCEKLKGCGAIYEKARDISSGILGLSLLNKRKSDSKDYYFDFLELCLTYGFTNITEFNLMLYHKEALKEADYVESIKDEIDSIRDGKLEVKFFQDTGRHGKPGQVQFPNNTFTYTRKLLQECGMIESKEKNYQIVAAQRANVEAIVKGEL